jgi:hypothetical protein
MFAEFFKRQTGLEVFGKGKKGWFYTEIRCAIFHQAETVGGWCLRRSGKLLDVGERPINAKLFIELLRRAVDDYAQQLQSDPVLWKNSKKKIHNICANCKAPA